MWEGVGGCLFVFSVLGSLCKSATQSGKKCVEWINLQFETVITASTGSLCVCHWAVGLAGKGHTFISSVSLVSYTGLGHKARSRMRQVRHVGMEFKEAFTLTLVQGRLGQVGSCQ